MKSYMNRISTGRVLALALIGAAMAFGAPALAEASGKTGDQVWNFQASYRVFFEDVETDSMFHETEALLGLGWRLDKGRLGYGVFGGRAAIGGSSTDGSTRRYDKSWISFLPSFEYRFLPIEDRLSSGDDPGDNFWEKAGAMGVMRIEAEIGAVNASVADLGAPAGTRAADLHGKTGLRVGGRFELGLKAALLFANYRREAFDGSELEDYTIGITLGRPALPFGISTGYRRVFAGSFDREFAFIGLEFVF